MSVASGHVRAIDAHVICQLAHPAFALFFVVIVVHGIVAASAFEQSLYEYGEMSSEEVEQYFEDVHAFFSSLPPASFPVLASIADDIVGFDGEYRLQFGLEALVAGLEALTAREQADLDRR